VLDSAKEMSEQFSGLDKALFAKVMRNIELLLQHDFIHGNLSAYNILYWGYGSPYVELAGSVVSLKSLTQ
jgi:serine/threonine-protein kinase RIO1